MPWTTPKDWVAGSALAAAELNEQIRDNEQWVKDTLTIYGQTSDSAAKTLKGAIAGTRVNRTGDQSIADSTNTDVLFDSEIWDTASGAASTFHSTSSNKARITVPSGRAGYYLVSTNLAWAQNTTGQRRLWVTHSSDGVIAADSRDGVATVVVQMSASCVWYFNSSDYAYVTVWQNSGGPLAIDGTTNANLPAFSMVFMGV